MSKNVNTLNLSEPLRNLTSAEIKIDPGDGNLTVDGFSYDSQQLASGTLEYFEKNGMPTWSVDSSNRTPVFVVKAARKGQHWLHLPWAACNGATTWQIHLNPIIPSSVIAHSDGGNIKLDLNGMPVTSVSAETGGGNIDVVLPDPTADLQVAAKSGAGNVVVQVPEDAAVRFRAVTGLGKLIVSPKFAKISNEIYQTPDYERADRKIELTLSSGAGNIIVKEQPRSY